MDPYDHHHTHVEEIPWSRLGELLIELAEMVRRDWQPEVVVGIAKGGVAPAVFLASALRLDFYPIKLSSRRNEDIVSDTPIWYVFPTSHVAGKRVLLVDDIVVAGRTLAMAEQALVEVGARQVRTATLARHLDSERPSYVVLETDALIVWPWDRDNLSSEGSWYINPEYLKEMREVEGYVPGPSPAREVAGRWLK